MRILVDTSVWADFLNGEANAETDALAEMLAGEEDVCTCGIIASEVFQGLRHAPTRARIRSAFGDLTFLEPSGLPLYLHAATTYRRLRDRGFTIRSTIDCIIASLAEEHGCYLLTRDRDLHRIADCGLLTVRCWPCPG